MNRFSVSILALLAILATFSSISIAGDTIKFAVVGPMSGDGAAMGIHEKNGVAMAVDEINAAGGVIGKKLEYIVEDDGQDPERAANLAQKIAADKDILFVVGHINSHCSIAAMPYYAAKQIPLISGSNTYPQLTKMGYRNYFRAISPDTIPVKQLFLLVKNELHKNKLAIFWESTAYGRGMRDILVSLLETEGIDLLAEASYMPVIDRDFTPHIQKFKRSGVDCVFMFGIYDAIGRFIKQASNVNFSPQFVAAGGGASARIIDIAGQAAEGYIAATAYDPNDIRPRQAEFIKKYSTRFKDKPTEWSAPAYDIVYVVKKAIEMGGTTRETLIRKLHTVKMEGITGRIEFDEFGDIPVQKQTLLKVVNGKFETYHSTQ